MARSCSNCHYFGKPPVGVKLEHICEAESDFDGYVEAKPDGVCNYWREKTAAQAIWRTTRHDSP